MAGWMAYGMDILKVAQAQVNRAEEGGVDGKREAWGVHRKA
jgi:hypothetical protein